MSFAHIDCDLYISNVTTLKHISPHLQTGTLLLFAEYFNYPGWKLYEHKAWSEFCQANGTRYSYIGLTALDGRVLVRID
ncbi:MAG: hypothetical protein CL566_00235 [Alphaproteobacteria bacterium]|nr:hypothetical protein [Alphaproteobacteria bacterium]